ncbi:MAG: ABC transporter permease [Anaerolineaceae bacterium]|nr:ABC transporter permease [Anaerolineaceae bacterium]
MRVFVIALKDFYQSLKKWQTFVFMLIMPPIFIIMFGKAFAGGGPTELPLLLISNQDQGVISTAMVEQLSASDGIRVELLGLGVDELQSALSDKQAAGAVLIVRGLDKQVVEIDDWSQVIWISGEDILQEIPARNVFERISKQMNAAAQFAKMSLDSNQKALNLITFETAFSEQIQNLTQAPVQIALNQTEEAPNPFSHPAPGMMLQFAIAGLTGVSAILVLEKSGLTEARLRMCSVPAWQVMLGHYLAICLLLGTQFFLLLAFGQIALGLDYLSAWASTLLISIGTILCIAAMGLLIGVISKTEEHTVVYAMLAMFVFSGLGGLWMPLETTGEAFQTIGYLTPLAWAMDGYQAILNSGAGISEIWSSLGVLLVYTMGFLLLTIVIYQRQKSRTH